MPILGGQIVVIATATRPGIAAFDAGNFSISSGVVNTIQDIDTAAVPEFAGLHVGDYDQMTLNGAAIDSHVAVNKDVPTVVEIHAHSASGPGILYWARSRGTGDTPTVVADTDELFNLSAVGFDGTDYAVGGWMKFAVDGTPGSDDMPTSWQLSLSADGSQTPTERIQVRANGAIEFSGDAGSSGEVLTSAGTGGPPVWTDPTTLETDPVFGASAAAGIDGTDISNWDTAFGWGNHASAGYLTTVDISSNTNLAATAPIVLTGDTLSLNQAATYAWTGAHTWGVDGTGVDLIAYGENSGDRMHWDQDGGSGSAGRLKLFGASEFIVIGKSALGASGAIGGTAGKAVLHISETITPANFTTPAALEFTAYMAANTFGGIVGLLATAGTTSAAHNTETLAVPLDLMLDLNHTSGTVVQANGIRISGDISGGGNTTAAAAIQIDAISGSGGTVTTCYGILLKEQARGSTNWQLYSEGDGHSHLGDDAARTYWGTANDAYISYDGTDMIVAPKAVGSGRMNVSGGGIFDGSLSLKSSGSATSLTADNQAVTVGDRSHIFLSSNDATATNRTFTLSNGSTDGQLLILAWKGTNAGEIVAATNAKLSATWTPTQYDTLTLMWSTDAAAWLEISRSANA